jgi:glucan phosphoethanolaminetransferase (alkaline phosphatase superfamily)
MFNNKKGLATGLIALILVMFVFALFSLLSITLWDQFETTIGSIDNETIGQNVKDQIGELRSKILWGDKLFVFTFVAMLIAFLISSVTIPTDAPEYLFVFAIILILTSVMAMVMSNTWAYMIEQPNFVSAALELPFTNYFIKYYPIYTFLTGILGAGLFYGRKKFDGGGGGSSFGGNELLGNAIE